LNCVIRLLFLGLQRITQLCYCFYYCWSVTWTDYWNSYLSWVALVIVEFPVKNNNHNFKMIDDVTKH